LLGDERDDVPPARPELRLRLPVGGRDVARRVHAHRERRAGGPFHGALGQGRVRRATGPRPAPDRAHEREPQAGSARPTPPTPPHAGNGPDSVCGTTSWFSSGARVLPSQVTGPPFRSSANSAAFSSKSSS